jgi:DNA adenine methylase
MILRYPGGKKKVAYDLAKMLVRDDESPVLEFREPYCGSAAVTFTLLQFAQFRGKVWLNDLDPGIAALWTTVIQKPEVLVSLIEKFVPAVPTYREYKDCLLDPGCCASMPPAELGFRKLAVHQMSFSGLGTCAGSPIGGWDQGPDNPKTYDISCRWNPKALIPAIRKLHLSLQGRVVENQCTQLDAVTVVQAPGPGVCLYLDPPYVKAGGNLYQFAYHEDEPHRQLAAALKASPHRWLLSYDDHPLVHELYAGYPIEKTKWAYTINSQTEHDGSEIIVLNRVSCPEMCNPTLIDDLFG